jgi:DNA ligase (NAD+)
MDFLRAEIRRHDELYHRHASPEITDAEYDELKQELLALENRAPASAQIHRVTSIRTSTDDHSPEFASQAHLVAMQSLAKAYSADDLLRFHRHVAKRLGKAVSYVVEPKFDGLAVSAVYEHGALVRVLTRGDGSMGDDVTANTRKYCAIPDRLSAIEGQTLPDRIEVRGEVFISLREFARLNQRRETEDESSYASPRNLAAGTLKSLHGDAVAERSLEIVFYGFGAFEPESVIPETQRHLYTQFIGWGLPTPDHVHVAESADALATIVEELGAQREVWAFPSDGVVIKVDALSAQRRLGTNAHGPEWAIAYKFTPERRTTRLKAITLQVGRTGLITPVAELEPVQVGNATISRASLHNADEIARRDLRVGDYVTVERGGEIIPAIVAVDVTRRPASSVPYTFPRTCPGCDMPLVRRDGQVAWRCINPACRAQLKRRLLHFASPACLRIRGLGTATVDKLIESGRVQVATDVYALTRADLLKILEAAPADALMREIAESKSVELWRLIHGLGIDGVGERAAKALAEKFGTLDALMAATPEEVAKAKGLSRQAGLNAAEFFQSSESAHMLRGWMSPDNGSR